MTIRVGSNIASLNAQRRLGDADSALTNSFERLSSGQRINRASDDAAGLAIADDLKAKSRIYSQAIRNGNDGISLLNIADSAISALSGIVTRIRELSEQAANGTYSAQQRAALDDEAQALSKEFTRITQTTSFNGIKIFNGSLGQGVRLQLGTGAAESINATIGGAVGTGSFGSLSSFTMQTRRTQAISLGDLNGDGILDLVSVGYDNTPDGYMTVRLGDGNGTFGAVTAYTAENRHSYALVLNDINSDGILDVITAGVSDSLDGYATVRLGLGNGTFGTATSYSTEAGRSNAVTVADLNQDGIMDLITAGRADGNDGYATVRLGSGNGMFGNAISYTTDSSISYGLAIGDVNQDGIVDLITAGMTDGSDGSATIRLGLGDGNFGSITSFSTESRQSNAVALSDLNSDGMLDLITAGRSDSVDGYATVRFGNGNGSFSNATYYTTETRTSLALTLGDLNGDGITDMVTAGYTDASYRGFATVRLGRGDGTFGQSLSFSTETESTNTIALGDLNGDGVLDLVSSGRMNGFTGHASVRLAETSQGLGALVSFSLKSRSEALQSMAMLNRTLENLALQRGSIGASQSRVGIALNNLQTARENFSAAESRIRDADISSEAAHLIRAKIIQQAASSVLAQANQVPALALKLLN